MGTMNDEYTIRGFNAGQAEAFEAIFGMYYATLCFFANKMVDDPESARDIVQDVFAWVFERKPHFDNLTALKSYLYSAVHNKSVNWVRRNRKSAQVFKEMGSEPIHHEDFCEMAQIEAEFFEEVFRAVESLPAECRRIFQMSYVERLDVKTISERLGIAQSTVKTQRQRAKKMLRERLRHLYPLAMLIFLMK